MLTNRWEYRINADEMENVKTTVAIRRRTAVVDVPTYLGASRECSPEENELRNIRSCAAEVAMSRILNLCWTGCGTREPDVGGFLEVKSVVDPKHRIMAKHRAVMEWIQRDRLTPVVLVLVDEETWLCRALFWVTAYELAKHGKLERSTVWMPRNPRLERPMDELPDFIRQWLPEFLLGRP